jgi:hypothetical protein
MDFVVFPPGHGSSVTDFWVWDAHEAYLRCPDDVSSDIGGWSARRALNKTQIFIIAFISPRFSFWAILIQFAYIYPMF